MPARLSDLQARQQKFETLTKIKKKIEAAQKKATSGGRLLLGQGPLPSGNGFHLQTPDGTRPAPWFCFTGWREYHDHPGHQDVPWATIRSVPRYAVLQLTLQLQRELNKTGVTLA